MIRSQPPAAQHRQAHGRSAGCRWSSTTSAVSFSRRCFDAPGPTPASSPCRPEQDPSSAPAPQGQERASCSSRVKEAKAMESAAGDARRRFEALTAAAEVFGRKSGPRWSGSQSNALGTESSGARRMATGPAAQRRGARHAASRARACSAGESHRRATAPRPPPRTPRACARQAGLGDHFPADQGKHAGDQQRGRGTQGVGRVRLPVQVDR